MNLASYFLDSPRIGVAEDDELWDLRRVVTLWLSAVERNAHAKAIARAMVPHDMALFIRLNQRGLDVFREALDWARENRGECEAMLGPGKTLGTVQNRAVLTTMLQRLTPGTEVSVEVKRKDGGKTVSGESKSKCG